MYHSDYYYNDHTYNIYRGKEGCTIVPVFGGPPVSVLHYTITLYSAVLCSTEGDGSGVGGGL